MKYRKKPVVIDAVQMASRDGEFAAAPAWLRNAMHHGDVRFTAEDVFEVKTLEGVMTGRTGDFIIRGVEGEIYPCKRSIFEAAYAALK